METGKNTMEHTLGRKACTERSDGYTPLNWSDFQNLNRKTARYLSAALPGDCGMSIYTKPYRMNIAERVLGSGNLGQMQASQESLVCIIQKQGHTTIYFMKLYTYIWIYKNIKASFQNMPAECCFLQQCPCLRTAVFLFMPVPKSQLRQYQAYFQSCYILKPAKVKFVKNQGIVHSSYSIAPTH